MNRSAEEAWKEFEKDKPKVEEQIAIIESWLGILPYAPKGSDYYNEIIKGIDNAAAELAKYVPVLCLYSGDYVDRKKVDSEEEIDEVLNEARWWIEPR